MDTTVARFGWLHFIPKVVRSANTQGTGYQLVTATAEAWHSLPLWRAVTSYSPTSGSNYGNYKPGASQCDYSSSSSLR